MVPDAPSTGGAESIAGLTTMLCFCSSESLGPSVQDLRRKWLPARKHCSYICRWWWEASCECPEGWREPELIDTEWQHKVRVGSSSSSLPGLHSASSLRTQEAKLTVRAGWTAAVSNPSQYSPMPFFWTCWNWILGHHIYSTLVTVPVPKHHWSRLTLTHFHLKSQAVGTGNCTGQSAVLFVVCPLSHLWCWGENPGLCTRWASALPPNSSRSPI